MRRLNQAHELLNHYDHTADVRTALKADSDLVRTSLIHALTQYHPHQADMLDAAEKDQCANFLRQYDCIFTTNYDLLLYWVINPRMTSHYVDGFGGHATISWQQGERAQNVHYLHGALHLYRDERSTIKRRYQDGVILDQLNEAMEAGQVPLFVSEGEWKQKMSAIEDSTYLKFCYDALVANEQELTLYGFGFNAADEHIFDAIAKSKTPALQVVLHTQADDNERQRIQERAEQLQNRIQRKQHCDVTLEFKESEDFMVWR